MKQAFALMTSMVVMGMAAAMLAGCGCCDTPCCDPCPAPKSCPKPCPKPCAPKPCC